MIEKTYRR